MQDLAFYPVKLVSRSVMRKRARRLLWMGLSAAFGFGCVCAVAPVMPLTPVIAQKTLQKTVIAAARPAVVLMDQAATLPAAPQVSPPAVPKPAVLASAAQPKPKAPPAQYPLSLAMKIENGDTLGEMLTDVGVSAEEAHNAVESLRHVYDLKKLGIGQNVGVRLDKAPGEARPVLASLTLPLSPTTRLQLTRQKDDDGFNVKKIDVPVERRLARAGGTIDSSLYETGMQSGLPPAMINEIIHAYSYDVDFQRDIKQGDAFDVLYERLRTKDGAAAGRGNVVYAELDLGDRELKIYRFVDRDGNADYYNARGESIRKALLRTPINGARITSGYGMRVHPLLGYSKMHRGIDFGAPLGTPIYAAGDGIVEYEGRKGGYGNYLRIKHNATYSSAYGHISRFASGIAPGSHVRQGQIVAYVGMTGMATGPHLHFEILVHNEQVNPANVKFKSGNVLQGHEMVAFRKTIEQIDARLATMPHNGDVAMAEQTNRDKDD